MLRGIAAALLALAIAIPARAGTAEDKALMDAAYALDIESVKSALKSGANPNAQNGNRGTPLTMVAIANLRGMSNYNPSDAARSGGFLMDSKIVHFKSVEIAKLLFASGARLRPHEKNILSTPISNGNVELVALLTDKGASPKNRLDGGYTPAEIAKQYGQEAVYQLLVSRGGIPVDSSASAQLELVRVAGSRDFEEIERAVKSGAKINGLDSNKRAALNSALSFGIPICTARDALAILWLLDHGADPNLKDESSYLDVEGIPLHLLIATNSRFNQPCSFVENTLLRMLKAGAKVSGVDSMGRTPLHIAAKFDNVRAAETLIKEGAKVMPRDKTGKTPLDYAESAAMIRLLKSYGATEQ